MDKIVVEMSDSEAVGWRRALVVELGDTKISVFANRVFNAAMAMTECRDCAAIVVWSWVCHDAVHVLHS